MALRLLCSQTCVFVVSSLGSRFFLTFRLKVPDKPPQAVENGRHQINDKIFRKLEEVRTVLIGETLDTERTLRP